MSKILLCNSSDSKATDLEPALRNRGYDVHSSLDLDTLEDLDDTPSGAPDSVDLGLIDVSCGRDGTSYCQAFHTMYPMLPIVLLVDDDAYVSNECQKLTCGNVLEWPFTARTVVDRVTRLLDRQQRGVLKAGRLTLNLQTRCVSYGDVTHRLTPKQCALLQVFMVHEGTTLTRRFLMATVWKTDYMGDTRTLDVHVRWLRERIEDNPSNPQYLRTVRGVGYRFGVPAVE